MEGGGIAPSDQSAVRRARARRGWWRKLLLYAAGTAVVAAVAWGFWPRPSQVEAGVVTRGPLTVAVLEEGKTRIRHRYTISAPVAGMLGRVPLRAGAAIRAGETVLASIEAASSGFLDPRTIAQGEAAVRSAEAARMLRESEFERAKEALELARKEFARVDELLKTRSVSVDAWDAAENRVKLLMREVNSAEFAIRVAEFEAAQAKAALLPVSALDLTATEPLRIVAPVNGFVLQVFEESARVVTQGTPIMEVGDLRDMEAEIELLSSDAVAVAPGAMVSIEQWGGGEPLRGRVSLVEPGGFTKISALGVEEQRVRARVDFLDPLPPGRELGDRFRVEARIVTWHGDNVLQVPSGALFRRGRDWRAFVIEGGRARARTVRVGHNSGTAAEVMSGLTEGETVVVHPPDGITDGVSVAVEDQDGRE
jgi:HlyD family secretion protein